MKELLKNKMNLMENRIDENWGLLVKASRNKSERDVEYHLEQIRKATHKLEILEMLWQNIINVNNASAYVTVTNAMEEIESRFAEDDIHMESAHSNKSEDTLVLDIKTLSYNTLAGIQATVLPELKNN